MGPIKCPFAMRVATLALRDPAPSATMAADANDCDAAFLKIASEREYQRRWTASVCSGIILAACSGGGALDCWPVVRGSNSTSNALHMIGPTPTLIVRLRILEACPPRIAFDAVNPVSARSFAARNQNKVFAGDGAGCATRQSSFANRHIGTPTHPARIGFKM